MDNAERKQMMRKTNMKIFPIYKMLAWDYIFFYVTDFLFLTQVKNISPADVVFKGSMFSLFCILMQIPANILIELMGRKNSIVLANALNCIYILILLLSRNLGDLLIAEFFSSIAYSLKNIAEPSLLNASIPPSRSKSKIFARINGRGATGFYVISAISRMLGGFLFAINGYIPLSLCLSIVVIVTLMSMGFTEPVQKKNDIDFMKSIKDIEKGFKYALKVDRLKALILAGSQIFSLLLIVQSYNVSLMQELNLSAIQIGAISSVISILGAWASRRQERFNKKFKNKSLTIIALMLSTSCVLSGGFAIIANGNWFLILLTILAILVFGFCTGMYKTIMDKYLRNFTNRSIDTKIFAANNLVSHSMCFAGGLFASFLLGKTTTAYSMLILGIVYTVIYVLVSQYMKTRLGKKPEEYSKEETKYDEMK